MYQHVADTMKPRKIAFAGESAGGGLATSAVLMNRDLHGPELAIQLSLYAMIDDRHDTPSGHAAGDGTGSFLVTMPMLGGMYA